MRPILIVPADQRLPDLEDSLGRAHANVRSLTDYVTRSQALVSSLAEDWRRSTGRDPSCVATVAGELSASLRAEGDLTDDQIEGVLRRLCPAPDAGVARWLGECCERLLLRTRPWFPLWRSFTHWLITWAAAHHYRQIIFLARDAIPFYLVARWSADSAVAGLDLRLLDLPRAALAQPDVAAHLSARLCPRPPTLIVDTGCYGTVATRLADWLRENQGADDVGIAFFASRNPRIFGYLNYLMARRYLSPDAYGPAGRRPMDFVIYGCDLLESLPKPYRCHVHPHAVTRTPSDLASFVLNLRVCAELTGPAEDRIDDCADITDQLYRGFREVRPGSPLESPLLLDSTAPKNPPPPDVLRRLGVSGLAPQDEVFGVTAG